MVINRAASGVTGPAFPEVFNQLKNAAGSSIKDDDRSHTSEKHGNLGSHSFVSVEDSKKMMKKDSLSNESIPPQQQTPLLPHQQQTPFLSLLSMWRRRSHVQGVPPGRWWRRLWRGLEWV
jgi:hypothetical protein